MEAHFDIVKKQILSTEEGKRLVASLVRSVTTKTGVELPTSLTELLELLPKEDHLEKEERVEHTEDEVDGGVELVVPGDEPVNKERKGGALMEQTVLDAILKVENSSKRIVEETVTVVEEDGLFQMEDGFSPEKGCDVSEQSELTLSGGTEEALIAPPPSSTSSHSLTTPTPISVSPMDVTHNGVSLPNSLDNMLPHEPLKTGSPSAPSLTPPTTLLYPLHSLDLAPLSVRMAGKLNEEDDDEVSVVGVSRTKKKKKGSKKKRKSVSGE